MKQHFTILLVAAIFSHQGFAEGLADKRSEQGYGEATMHLIEMIHKQHGPTAAGMPHNQGQHEAMHPRKHNKHYRGREHYEEFNNRAHQRKRAIFGSNN